MIAAYVVGMTVRKKYGLSGAKALIYISLDMMIGTFLIYALAWVFGGGSIKSSNYVRMVVWIGPYAWLLANTSTTLSEDVLGFDSMFDGLNAAMSEEAVKDYLESVGVDYDSLTGEQKAAVKGNLGVMYFASDAAYHTAEEVMQSLGVVAQVLGASGEGCTQEVFENKYLQNLSRDEQDFYNTNVKYGTMTYEEFLQRTGTSGGDFSSSYGTLIQMEMAAEALKEAGVSNTTGVSTLGAMYALSAGYFNSDYYTGGDENKPDNYGDFDSVQQAMGSQPGFSSYLNEQGLTDLQYYLDYMKSLDKDSIDLRDPNAFVGLNTQN